MMQVIWTEPAVTDLENIHAYIAVDSQIYADALLAQIFDAVDNLASFPRAGHLVPELEDDATREIVIGRYRVVYDISSEIVRVLTVIHGARRFPPPWQA